MDELGFAPLVRLRQHHCVARERLPAGATIVDWMRAARLEEGAIAEAFCYLAS